MEAIDQAVNDRGGPYLLRELRHYLRTALTGFKAAIIAAGPRETASHPSGGQPANVVNTVDDVPAGRPSTDTLVNDPQPVHVAPAAQKGPYTTIHTG